MLKDVSKSVSVSGDAALSIEKNHSILILIAFIDSNISNFRKYYLKNNEPDDENKISFHLVNFFNSCLMGFSEYTPVRFSFVKNPAQQVSLRETDIGVVILSLNSPSDTIIEFESKRLSDSSNNTEYVYGKRGGIERFKRNLHGSHLPICGMFGYVQSKTIPYWVKKINEWIKDLGTNNPENSIDWSAQDERLIMLIKFKNSQKFQSSNSRTNNGEIILFHYMLNLKRLNQVKRAKNSFKGKTSARQ